MECRQHKMACLGRDQRSFNGLQITHLSDHDDIGILTQYMHESITKRSHVRHHFLLHDNAALVFVYKFDRIFDRDNL